MKRCAFLLATVAVFLMPGFVLAQGEVVGRLTQVEGRVDLLKGGNLPANPVKVDDTVGPKDVIRTKSLSKAQITFIDNSVITISPESRVAIEEYMVDTVQGKRQAVLEIFQGLALAVVNKIFKTEEPDFVIKTHTAIMGVRGTEIGIRIQPNSSTILNFKGLTQVGNVFPETSRLFLKAFKVAFSFGSLKNLSNRWVLLRDMQGTAVGRNLPPTLPYGITTQDRQMFMRQLTAVVPSMSKQPQGTGLASGASSGATGSSLTKTTPVSFNNPGEQNILTTLNTVTVPPVVTPQAATSPTTPVQSSVTPSNQTYNFTQVFEGTYTKPSESPYAVANYISSSSGSGTRTGVYASAFTANFSITATGPSGTFSPSSSGSFSATSSASVSGPSGGTLTGTMQMNASTGGGTTFTLSGPVTLNSNGNLSYQTTGTFNLGSTTGTTTGTWTQTNSTTTSKAR